MSYSRENVEKTKKEFEEKRNRAESERTKRLNEIYSLSPEIQIIDKSLSLAGMEILNAMRLSGDAVKQKIQELRDKNLALQKRRAEILVSLGFDENYTDTVYECPICKDTGYDGVKLCKCMKNALILKGYESSGIGNLIMKQNFESFSFDYYSGEDKEIMKKNYDVLLHFVNNFDRVKKNFLLAGATGLGKTHLSSAVAKKLIDNGYNVVYETAQNIFFDFERDRFSFSKEKEFVSDKYLDCDLLIIDDIGTETVTQFSSACLYNIINTRISRNLPIIASTNLRPDAIRKTYNDRITSRLFGEFEILKFVGEDIRKQKIMK